MQGRAPAYGTLRILLDSSGLYSYNYGVNGFHHKKAVTTMHQESSIFNFDGQNLIRVHTILRTEAGESAVGTRLDPNNPGYPALMQKRSYTGEVTLFGHQCEASYAPLTDQDGRLTGALMVCIRK